MDFKERLKDLRKRRGLSQVALAERLGLSKSTIGAYETGDITPSLEALNLIADFFNVDIDYLLGKEEVSTYIITPEQKEVVDAVCEDEDLLDLFRKMLDNNNFKKKLMRLVAIMEEDDGNTDNR